MHCCSSGSSSKREFFSLVFRNLKLDHLLNCLLPMHHQDSEHCCSNNDESNRCSRSQAAPCVVVMVVAPARKKYHSSCDFDKSNKDCLLECLVSLNSQSSVHSSKINNKSNRLNTSGATTSTVNPLQ